MNLISFYTEVIDAFNKNEVEYLIVGGHAVNFHGHLRATLDLDIWINDQPMNLEKLFKSFIDLGFKVDVSKLAIERFKNDHIIKIPKENDIVELLDSFIIREDFSSAFKNREIAKINSIDFIIIGLQELITIKSKSNREKDLLDLKELKKIKNENN